MSGMANTTSRRTELTDAQGDHAERIVAEAIHNTRRRYALYYLHKRNGPVDLQELVRQVASWENCSHLEDVPVAQRKSVYSALHQTHLPYLEERGLVVFDRETNEVECLLENSELNLSLAADLQTTVRWHRVYLVLTGIGAFVLGGFWAGVPPLARVSPVAVAAILVGTYAVASVSHWYDVYQWRRRVNGTPPDFVISIDRDSESDDAGIGRAARGDAGEDAT